MEDWLGLTLAVPPLAGEAAINILFEVGALGVWEDQPDNQGRLVYKAGFSLGEETRLMAEVPAALVSVAESLEFPLVEVALSMEIKPGEDFSETWKRDLHPMFVGPRMWVAPTWWNTVIPTTPEGVILKIDPGLAFGSGRHPSTFLCLIMLHDLAEELTLYPTRVLDLGSGSGILALGAALLFPEADVLGLDIDQDTIQVAEENRRSNNLDHRVTFKNASIDELDPDVYELIMANLTLNDLTALAPEIKRVLSLNGKVIVSGLLADQTAALEDVFAELGLRAIRHLGQEEWSTILLGPLGEGASRQIWPKDVV
ncbi:MAG: 50S ribosomal protein L11 methyltransferase [Deltaproteobacteria bacterium]|jgi:ribosomal protein L11 methyltransferase|nr:50S ribosomal protein L11 methyltransferase [Deltaproteobacteria bacterium]